MKNDDDSKELWKELEYYNNQDKKPSWCCEAIKKSGCEWLQCIEEHVQLIHRLKVNYCLHCGKKL